jgi:hypothetical protein
MTEQAQLKVESHLIIDAAVAHALDLQEYDHFTPGGLYRELVEHWAL